MSIRLRFETARSKLRSSRRSSAASGSSLVAIGPGSEKAHSIVSQPSPLPSPLPHVPHTRASGTWSTRTLPSASSLLEPQKPSQPRADPGQSRARPAETIADRSASLSSSDLQQIDLHQQPQSQSQTQPPPPPPPPAPPAAPSITLDESTPALAVPSVVDESSEPLHPLPTPEDLASPRQLRPLAVRHQSLVHNSNARVIKTLLDQQRTRPSTANSQEDYFSLNVGMLHRKIWVKRPSSSATLIQIREDDLVDDVRDVILKKYANSLGRTFDAPDVCMRIVSRDPAARPAERTLGPEETMCRTLDEHFPGGQTVDEALIIDVPQRRTPRPSPRVPLPPHLSHYCYADARPAESDADYFPTMPEVGVPSPASLPSLSHEGRQVHPHQDVRSIAVLTTGQVPPLPSPGAARQRSHRPRPHRNITASPTQAAHQTGPAPSAHHLARPTNRARLDSAASETKHAIPAPPPLPTPPPLDKTLAPPKTSTPPTPRVQSPDPRKYKKKRNKETGSDASTLPSGLLDGSVPPINVLIVEDNIINLKLLEAFMKRLKVRWQTAMNGRDAVTKWRAGGFHLVLMDIQLPIMSGLDATKEIRRLERVNDIGVFSNNSASSTALAPTPKDMSTTRVAESDVLGDAIMFKSPVIIVALTASSLQSDRHEALAVGCNDFLTKPVNFVWLERKVKEWGCMQALIDYDGWRKWKTFADGALSDHSKDKFKTTKKKINLPSISKHPSVLAAAAAIPSPSPEHQALAQATQAPIGDVLLNGVVEVTPAPTPT